MVTETQPMVFKILNAKGINNKLSSLIQNVGKVFFSTYNYFFFFLNNGDSYMYLGAVQSSWLKVVHYIFSSTAPHEAVV